MLQAPELSKGGLAGALMDPAAMLRMQMHLHRAHLACSPATRPAACPGSVATCHETPVTTPLMASCCKTVYHHAESSGCGVPVEGRLQHMQQQPPDMLKPPCKETLQQQLATICNCKLSRLACYVSFGTLLVQTGRTLWPSSSSISRLSVKQLQCDLH